MRDESQAGQLAVREDSALDRLGPSIERAKEFMSMAKAPATVKAYRSDWRDFEGWCETKGIRALPATAETVACYVSDLAAVRSVSTIQRRMSAVSQAHQAAGHESPTRSAVVQTIMAGIRREKGTAQKGKRPALVGQIRRMVKSAPDGLLGMRDRALLLLGFAGAFRRSELVGLDVEDVEFVEDGLVVTLRRSKTDQEGEGRKVGIPHGRGNETCPVRAVRFWLDGAGISEGPLLRSVNRHGRVQPGRLSAKAVALVVKRYAEAAGLESVEFSGHSLRAGLATSAAMAGASERAIMNQTGHRSVQMVRRYIRDGSLFRENAADVVGL
jgi:site-specific recombinase XerD